MLEHIFYAKMRPLAEKLLLSGACLGMQEEVSAQAQFEDAFAEAKVQYKVTIKVERVDEDVN